MDMSPERLAQVEAEDRAFEEKCAGFEKASERVSYDLSFKRAETPRKFREYELTGDDLDDAFSPAGQKSTGHWECPHFMEGDARPPEDWFREFFKVAITEAVHEAMEWFRIDGRLVINPHGKNEMKIFEVSDRFGEELWDRFAADRVKAKQEE